MKTLASNLFIYSFDFALQLRFFEEFFGHSSKPNEISIMAILTINTKT